MQLPVVKHHHHHHHHQTVCGTPSDGETLLTLRLEVPTAREGQLKVAGMRKARHPGRDTNPPSPPDRTVSYCRPGPNSPG